MTPSRPLPQYTLLAFGVACILCGGGIALIAYLGDKWSEYGFPLLVLIGACALTGVTLILSDDVCHRSSRRNKNTAPNLDEQATYSKIVGRARLTDDH